MKMWNTVYAKQIGWKILHGMCNYCIQRHFSVGLCNRKIHIEHRCRGPTPDQTEPVVVNASTPGPSWRILFLGSDDFAVESLKLLSKSRKSNDGILRSLEVVTLANDVPVKRFAEENELPIHTWPLGDLHGRFDVGVVVSFGCLLQEKLIKQFPYGILNVHPSLLPRWRGPAPVFHTILNGDTLTGVTVMQIRPKRFDVGPILHQGTYQIPENCTADQLGAALANQGAGLLLDTLRNLPERILNKREQASEGETLAPKINPSMSWLQWEDQSCLQIDRLYRAISSRVRTDRSHQGRLNRKRLLYCICEPCPSNLPSDPSEDCVDGQNSQVTGLCWALQYIALRERKDSSSRLHQLPEGNGHIGCAL